MINNDDSANQKVIHQTGQQTQKIPDAAKRLRRLKIHITDRTGWMESSRTKIF